MSYNMMKAQLRIMKKISDKNSFVKNLIAWFGGQSKPFARERNLIRRELAKLTSHINFNCNFKDGRCHNHNSDEKCCCRGCASNSGYLLREDNIYCIIGSRNLKHVLHYYASHFNPKTGFWRKDKGCNLPRSLRSTICLTHHCNEITNPTHDLILRSLYCNNGRDFISSEYILKSLIYQFDLDLYKRKYSGD